MRLSVQIGGSLMINGRSVLAIIPARGGSKGLPGKNIKNLNGKPLINWTIEQALKCPLIDDIHVSTDSKEISEIAQTLIPVDFLRPEYLSTDTTDVVDVALYVLDYYEKNFNKTYDILVLLEPTSPLRQATDISDAIKLFSDCYEKTDSVVSIGEIHLENPFRAKIVKDNYIESIFPGKHVPRQELPKTYFPYGVFYGIKTSALRESRTFFPEKMTPYFIQRWQNFEIDDYTDFLCIERILQERENNK